MHLGLIGGIGPAATVFYYRGLIKAFATMRSPLELTIAHADTKLMLDNFFADSRQQQAEVFCHHVTQLAGAGAQIAAVTSIAGHFCIQELESRSPLPLVNALDELRKELKRRGVTRVGLLGSQPAMETALYGTLDELNVVVPRDDELVAVGEQYIAMAGAQRANDGQRDLFFRAGQKLCSEQGAEVVALVGTDLFLAFEDTDPGFPVIDSAHVHVQALAALSAQTDV